MAGILSVAQTQFVYINHLAFAQPVLIDYWVSIWNNEDSTQIDFFDFRHGDSSDGLYIGDSIVIYLPIAVLRYNFSILGACKNCSASIE